MTAEPDTDAMPEPDAARLARLLADECYRRRYAYRSLAAFSALTELGDEMDDIVRRLFMQGRSR